jgi:Signal transduction histidine kinase
MTTEEAQAKAREKVGTLRFSGANYFWIHDTTPKMVMHPLKSELDGKDLSDVKDPKGVRSLVEMAKVVRENSGSRGTIGHRPARPSAAGSATQS